MPYGGSSGTGRYGSGGSSTKKPEGGLLRGLGAPIRFAGNLVTDVKDAVVGLPTGVIMTIRDPVGSAKAIGTTSWQTWSPLFTGHPGQFAENFYNHPLAPLLDIATVFTLGTGSVARGAGALSKAGVGGRAVERVAGLRVPGEVKLLDPTGQGRHAVHKQLSGRAGRRLVQEGIMSLEAHLPQLVSNPLKRARFEGRFAIDMAHRAAAKNLMLATMLKAGEKLSDTNPEAPRARAEIMAGAHINLMRHNREIAVTPEEALARGIINKSGRVKGNSHYTLIVDPAHFTGSTEHASSLARTQKQIARWNRQREANAELAHELPKLKQELEYVNGELARMHREGHVVTVPASKTRRPTPRQHMEQEAADIMELQRRSLEIERRIERAHNAQTKHSEAVAELDTLINQRRELERRGFTEKYMSVAGSAADFEKAAGEFGRLTTTTRVSKAARTQDGRIYIVPRHDPKMLGYEMGQTASLLRKAWEKPTYLWKLAMIGYTPRSIVNNAVGNWAIYALREGGSVEGFQALYDAVRLTKGDDAALLTMKAATPFKRNNWLYRYFGTELGNVFGHELLTDGARAKSKLSKRMHQGLYPAVHKIADEPVRVASIAKFLRESPEVKALTKRGIDTDTAISRALRGNPSLQRRAAEHARVVAGDYFTLRTWERRVRDIIPFYLWDRHIVKTTGNMVADTPGRVAIAQQISDIGVEETERLLGDIPEFLKGAVPFDLLGLDSDKGRKNVLLTASLNPWATIGEIAALGQALTIGGGQPRDALMGAHPFITGGIEFVTGRSILSGAPKDTDGGLVFSVADNAISGLPMFRIAEALVSEDEDTTAAGNPRLYRRDDKSPISSFLGVPIRSVSPEAASRMKASMTGEAGKEPKKSNRYST